MIQLAVIVALRLRNYPMVLYIFDMPLGIVPQNLGLGGRRGLGAEAA